MAGRGNSPYSLVCQCGPSYDTTTANSWGKLQTVFFAAQASTAVRQGKDDSVTKRIFSERVFSGDYSRDMWNGINTSETAEDLRDALYLVCCRLQELETKLAKYEEQVQHSTPIQWDDDEFFVYKTTEYDKPERP